MGIKVREMEDQELFQWKLEKAQERLEYAARLRLMSNDDLLDEFASQMTMINHPGGNDEHIVVGDELGRRLREIGFLSETKVI